MNNPATLTIADALQDATQQFMGVDPHTASLDARLLLQHILQCDWEELVLNKQSPLSPDEQAQWQYAVAQRAQHKPVAKIIGHAEFYGAVFKTTTDTLDPRPDSETLIETVQTFFPSQTSRLSLLDLGTGTGCLLITLLNLYPNSLGTGVDISSAALQIAMENAETHQVTDRANFMQSDWFENVPGLYDLIISNPPYITHAALAELAPTVSQYDPKLALDGGADGLDAYRILTRHALSFLKVGGWLAVEIGYDQAESVTQLFNAAHFQHVALYYDLSGHPRVIIGQK